jgi:hypothetical protein
MSINNIGTTRANLTVHTAIFQLSATHKLDYIKVTLKAPMSSGHAVDVGMYDANSSIIKGITDTTSRATHGAKKTLIFKPTGEAGTVQQFEDFYLSLNPQGGAAIQRVAVYATPIDDNSQLL